MCAFAATVQNDVAASQDNPIGYKGRCTERKRQGYLRGWQRDRRDAWKSFVAPIHLHMFQFQPYQPCLEISGACYRQIDACVAECGCVTVRICKCKFAAFCHMPRPLDRRTVLCDPLKLLVSLIKATSGNQSSSAMRVRKRDLGGRTVTAMQFWHAGG